MNPILALDTQIVLLCQTLGDWLLAPMTALSLLGSAQFYIIAAAIAYWCWNSRLTLRIATVLFVSSGVNAALKIAWHQPRPYWFDSSVRALSSERSFGLPSGHAQMSTSLWALLAAIYRRAWLWAAALVLLILIGFSRIYLGVHFLTDVVAGWTIGAFIVLAFVRWEPAVSRWLADLATGLQVLVALAASAMLLLFTRISLVSVTPWVMPDIWGRNIATSGAKAANPLDPQTAAFAAGALFGLFACKWKLSPRGGFRTDGSVSQRVLRCIVGLPVVAILWFGPKYLLHPPDAGWSMLLNYLQAALVGAWVSTGAPLLFLRLKLVQPEDHEIAKSTLTA